MRNIKEITVYSIGDSTKISTWSNVPFFFTNTLEEKGILVNRVDISANRRIERIFTYTIKKLLDFLFKNNTYNYFRSGINYRITRRKIKRSVKKYKNSDAFLFLTFSFSAVGLTDKPIIQFCDWTYDHYFRYFQARKPNFLEHKSIKREDSQINGSNLVVPLFPSVTDYMKERYTSKIVYLGNVINSVFKSSAQEILEIKKNSEKILFIGSSKYFEGALALINAFSELKKRLPLMSLHFIGLNKAHFKNIEVPDDVFFYGYLDKGDDNQRDTYYKLLKEARVFVNTTPKWSAFSASIGAMYFYTPVIVPSYDEFTRTFGKDFKGGAYCDDNNLLSKKIESLINDGSYLQICINANKLVEKFTWSSYIDHLLNEIKEL